jgi:hypothetical protein
MSPGRMPGFLGLPAGGGFGSRSIHWSGGLFFSVIHWLLKVAGNFADSKSRDRETLAASHLPGCPHIPHMLWKMSRTGPGAFLFELICGVQTAARCADRPAVAVGCPHGGRYSLFQNKALPKCSAGTEHAHGIGVREATYCPSQTIQCLHPVRFIRHRKRRAHQLKVLRKRQCPGGS